MILKPTYCRKKQYSANNIKRTKLLVRLYNNETTTTCYS